MFRKMLIQFIFLCLVFIQAEGVGKKKPWMVERLNKPKRMMTQRIQTDDDCENKNSPYLDVDPFEVVYVGTNKDELFIMDIKLTQDTLWLVDPSFSQFPVDKNAYDPSQSKTSNVTGATKHETIGKMELSGSYITDEIHQNFFTDHEQKFVQGFGNLKSLQGGCEHELLGDGDGLIGFAWDLKKNKDPVTVDSAPILHILNGLENRTVAFWFFRYNFQGKGEMEAGTRIYYGQPQPINQCSNQLYWTPFLTGNENGPWLTFNVDGFKVGKFEMKKKQVANIDAGKQWLALPTRQYNVIYKLLKPEFDDKNQILTVDCSLKNDAVDWVFTINGQDFAVPARKFISDVWLKNGKCAVTLQQSDDRYLDYSFGMPFLRTWCPTFDVENNRLGLSQSKNSG